MREKHTTTVLERQHAGMTLRTSSRSSVYIWSSSAQSSSAPWSYTARRSVSLVNPERSAKSTAP